MYLVKRSKTAKIMVIIPICRYVYFICLLLFNIVQISLAIITISFIYVNCRRPPWIHLPRGPCANHIPLSILWETMGHLEGVGVSLQSSTDILA